MQKVYLKRLNDFGDWFTFIQGTLKLGNRIKSLQNRFDK